jgi:predicted extracellular nuclease
MVHPVRRVDRVNWTRTNLSGSIPAGGYYLVQQAAGAGGTTPLPTPDATGTTAMSATAGKVVVVNNQTTITAGTACPSPGVIDLVGYGTGTNCFEGSGPTASLSNTTAALRAGGGCTDTDQSNADFTPDAPNPRNSAAPANSCTVDAAPTVTATSPENGAANVAANTDVSITFSEVVNVTGSWFTISCTTSGVHTATASGGPTTFTLNPDADFTFGETCTVTVAAAQVADQDANDPPDAMAADHSFSFGVGNPCEDPVTATIPSIQGSGPAAAITGTVTTEGVVVGDFEGSAALGGFYLQDASGDGDAATSDGIFVFTGSANTVTAGQSVRVTGFARERFNQTALNGANNNNAAVPPTNIVACGSGSVDHTDVTMPFATADFPERYEGMLVRLAQDLVISEYFNYERFGEMVLALPLDGETRPFTGTAIDEPGAPANARTIANSLSRITLDDGLGIQNPPSVRHPNGDPFSLMNRFRGGDTVANTVGVLGFDFNLYRIQPTGPADYTSVNPRPDEPEDVGGSVRVAAMNTLNYFLTLDTTASDTGPGPCGGNANLDCRGADADQPLEFTRQRDKLLAALSGLGADVIGLNELENTPGVDPLGDPTSGIVPGLNAKLGAGTYDAITTGTIGTDAIKVGLVYKPGVVTPVGSHRILDSTVDPRFLDTKSRPVLAQTFEVNETGARFTVAVNHLKSKGSDCNDVGDPDIGDGQGNCNLTRKAAAEALVDWLATDPTGSGDPDFLIMGDLNSYAQEDPIDAVKEGADDGAGTGDDYTNLIHKYQGTYAYSFVFDGQAGYLDHALSSAHMTGQVTGAADWHINADEPDLLDYDTTFKPLEQEAIYEPNAYRSSDHDALVVGLDACDDVDPTLSVTVAPTTLWPPTHKYVTVQADVDFDDNFDASPTLELVSVTSNEPDDGNDDGNTVDDIVIVDQDTFKLRAERSASGTGRIYTIIYRVTDDCGNSTTASATVTVPLEK